MAGRVTVNDEVGALGRRVDPPTDHVALDGVPVVVDETLVHWLLNKPAGPVTTVSDPQGRDTVLGLVPAEPRVFPVGRLDRDSEGLLILTNDGELANRLMHPRFGVEKEYFVEVEGVPSSAARAAARRRRPRRRPDPTRRVRLVQTSAAGSSAVEIVVKEGRKRMVRRMCSVVGHPVLRLVRVRIGPLRDPKLAPGAWRELSTGEVRDLCAAALGETVAAAE